MRELRYRKYPRVCQKKEQDKEQPVSITVAAAIGILTFTFVKGMFWGYLLKKRLNE